MRKTLYLCACASVADGGGIYRCTLEDGRLTVDAHFACDRPMYAVTDETHLHILLRQCVGQNGGYLRVSLDFTAPTVPVDSQGSVPCHLAADGGEVWWVNYLSGNVVKLDGAAVSRQGNGPNPARQEEPHTHFVAPLDSRLLGVCDLGTDTLALYDRGLAPLAEARVPAGYGIRHFVHDAAHGLIYAVNELVPSVSIFTLDGDTLIYRSTVPLPCADPAASGAAIRLSPDGRRLWVSVREENALFALDVIGTPIITAKLSCGGDSPRDFALCGDWIVCTNEKSDTVTVLARDGACTDTLHLPSPLCVACAD